MGKRIKIKDILEGNVYTVYSAEEANKLQLKDDDQVIVDDSTLTENDDEDDGDSVIDDILDDGLEGDVERFFERLNISPFIERLKRIDRRDEKVQILTKFFQMLEIEESLLPKIFEKLRGSAVKKSLTETKGGVVLKKSEIINELKKTIIKNAIKNK